ncbi:MAG: nucleotide exchange factor GrpE [Succiniclasticum sp.]|nr:nucleotide exchange factor GrpE [Succiniclasticum sp.]
MFTEEMEQGKNPEEMNREQRENAAGPAERPGISAEGLLQDADTPGKNGGDVSAGENVSVEGKAEGQEEAQAGEGAAETDANALQDKLTALAAQLKVKEEEATELQNRLLRLQADFENFRRRNTAERQELSTYVTIDVVNRFLKILDNFGRAEAAAVNATDVQSVVDGMAGIQKQFVKTLEDLGVTEIPAEGEKFDPHLHEAVMRGQNPELEDETIDMVFEKGYVLREKVVRHSKVRVISNE